MSEYTLSLTILGKDKASGMFERLDRSLNSMINTAMGVTIARVFEDIGAAIGRMGIQALNSIAYVQNLDVVLTSLVAREMYNAGAFESVGAAMDSAGTGAEKLIQDLGEWAILSPYTMEATTNMFRLMMAFGSTTGQSTLLTKGLMQMGAGLGASNEQVQRMAYNLAQIQLEGKVTALDIRQLALAGLPLNDVLVSVGKQFGINIKDHLDFNKALASGKITWQQFTEGFAKYADENFGGASERMARTLSGLKSTFTDVFTLTMPQLLGPAVEEITGILGTLLDAFLYVFKDPRLKEIGKNLGEAVHEWIAPVRVAVENFTRLVTGGIKIETAFSILFGGLKKIVKDAVLGMLKSFAEHLPAAAASVSNFIIKMFSGAATALPDLAAILMPVFNGILTAITTAAPGILTGWINLWIAFGQTLIDQSPTILANVTLLLSTLMQTFLTNVPQMTLVGTTLIATLLTAIITNAPQLITTGASLLQGLASGLASMIPTLVPLAATALQTIIDAIVTNLPGVLSAGVTLLGSLMQGITNAIPTLIPVINNIIVTITTWLATNMPALVTVGVNLLVALMQGVVSNIGIISQQMPIIITAFVETVTASLPQILTAGLSILMAIMQGVVDNAPLLINAAVTVIQSFVTFVTNNITPFLNLALYLIFVLGQGLINALPQLTVAALQLIEALLTYIGSHPAEILTAAGELVLALGKGIISAIGLLSQVASDLVLALVTALVDLGGKLFDVGKALIAAFKEGVTTGDWSGVKEAFAAGSQNAMPDLKTRGSEMGQGLAAGFDEGASGLGETITMKIPGLGGQVLTATKDVMKPAGTQLATDFEAGFNETLSGTQGFTTGIGTWVPKTSQALVDGLNEGVKINWPTFDTTLEEQTSLTGTTMTAAAKVLMLPVGPAMVTGMSEGLDASWPTFTTNIDTKATTLGTSLQTTMTTPMSAVGADMMIKVQESYDLQWPIFQGDVEATFGSLYSIIGASIGLVNNIGAEIVIGVTKTMNDNSPKLFGAASALTTGIVIALGKLGAAGQAAGSAAAAGVAAGIRGGTAAAVAAAIAFSNAVSNAIRVHWQINSPSKVFAKIGESVPEGLAKGITDKESLPVNAVDRLMEMTRIAQSAPAPQRNAYVTVNANIASDFDLDKLTRDIARRINA